MDLSLKSRNFEETFRSVLDANYIGIDKEKPENNNDISFNLSTIKCDSKQRPNDINLNEVDSIRGETGPVDYSNTSPGTPKKNTFALNINSAAAAASNIFKGSKKTNKTSVENGKQFGTEGNKDNLAKRFKIEHLASPSVSNDQLKPKDDIVETESSKIDRLSIEEGEAPSTETSPLSWISLKDEWSRYWCRTCDKHFRSNIGLQRHEIEVHSKKMVECDKCTKMFRCDSALNDHKKRVHGPRQYACGLCNADFTSEAYLRAHAKVHAEKKHTCVQCDHSFVNKTDLNNHMRVHNGDKPYPCNVCGKRFRHVSGFYTHVRIHTGETPYQCDFCEKMFTNASNFQTHRKIHTREKKFKCEECGKEFIQQSNFSRHMRIHTKERPYGCRQCEAKFTYSTALKRHEEREHGILPFPCEKCGRTFLNQTSLIRHHTGCQLKDCVKTVAQESSSLFL